MSALDWTIVAAYLLYVVWDGSRRARSARRLDGYFLADRSLPWWAVGLSVMATQLSAITLVGTTGQGYMYGMSFVQFYYGLPLAMVILCVTVVPFFHRARIYTAYQFLEKRFDARTRTLTSFFFLVSRGLGVGVIIAAPAVILSIVLGWNEILTIAAIGLTTTVYTMIGGVLAVTWTDVKQMVLIFVGMGVAMSIIVSQLPADISLGDALHVAGATGHLTTVDTSLDLSNSYTLWSGLIGGLFLMLAYFGTDQSQVQRYLTAKSIAQARTSLLMSAFVKIPMQFFILLIGVLVFVFYHFQPPPLIFNPAEQARVEQSALAADYQALQTEFQQAHALRRQAATRYARAQGGGDAVAALAAYRAADAEFNAVRDQAGELARQAGSTGNDVNYVFPTFILNRMPIGVIGLMIAAIFAAAMSSVSSELNALATASVIDFYRRHLRPDAPEHQHVLAARIATAFWGIFACFVATQATTLGSLIEVVNRFGSYFYGSLLGVFVLAIGIPRATARGAFWGLLAGIATVWLVSRHTPLAFLWFNVVGCLAVVVVGYLLSLTEPPKTASREDVRLSIQH